MILAICAVAMITAWLVLTRAEAPRPRRVPIRVRDDKRPRR